MKVVKNLLYTKDHEWARVEGEFAYIGITDFAQNALGDIVFVELPEVDSEFKEGDSFGTIESVKAAEDAYIPVSGKVVEVNENIVDNPALVNEDAYENWFLKIELSDKSELGKLMDDKAYEEYCSKEG